MTDDNDTLCHIIDWRGPSFEARKQEAELLSLRQQCAALQDEVWRERGLVDKLGDELREQGRELLAARAQAAVAEAGKREAEHRLAAVLWCRRMGVA